MFCRCLQMIICFGTVSITASLARSDEPIDSGKSPEAKLDVTGTVQESESLVVDWTKETDKAEWQPRDSSGEVVFQDKLWIMGGWYDSFSPPPRDVWSSPNGKTWNKVVAEAPWKYSTGATLDRLTHRCHILEASRQSYRLRDAKRRKQTTHSSGSGAKSKQ